MSAYELFHNLAEIADVPTLLFLVDENESICRGRTRWFIRGPCAIISE